MAGTEQVAPVGAPVDSDACPPTPPPLQCSCQHKYLNSRCRTNYAKYHFLTDSAWKSSCGVRYNCCTEAELSSSMDTRTVMIAAKNMFLGANLKSLSLLKSPKHAVHYATECLFIDRVLHSNGDLPQRHPWEVFGVSSNFPVVLCPTAAGEWFKTMPSFAVGLVGLCSIVQIIQSRIIFEIGTYHGSGAIHLSANAPQADVYTLDLATGDRTSPSHNNGRWVSH
jgi:hypothetical protein